MLQFVEPSFVWLDMASSSETVLGARSIQNEYVGRFHPVRVSWRPLYFFSDSFTAFGAILELALFWCKESVDLLSLDFSDVSSSFTRCTYLVFSVGHFADHPLEDIIEKIACQFTARHIRGRPRAPFWYPGWPLYVCDSRYNDRERIFVKIKNWNSCVPEEVRKSTEFMPIYPFERSVFPRRFGSPFLVPGGKPLKAPGGLGDTIEKGEGEKIEGGGTGRKRPKRAAAQPKSEHTDRVGQSKGLYVGPVQGSAATATATSGQVAPQTPVPQPRPPLVNPRAPTDRSIMTAAGGISALGGNASVERLPPETGEIPSFYFNNVLVLLSICVFFLIAKHFDRDPETNEVLWFAAPPVDIAHPPAPRHSLAYLHYLAKKRKKEPEDLDVEMDGPESPVEEEQPFQQGKRTRLTTTERVHSLLEEYGLLET